MAKMTYANAIDVMVSLANGKAVEDAVKDEAVGRMADLKDQLAKRNGSGKSGPTKHQKEVAEVVDKIYNRFVEQGDGMTATEISKEFNLSVHEASAYVKKLIDGGKVERRKEGKATRYYLI